MFKDIIGFLLILLFIFLAIVIIALSMAGASVALAHFVHWLTPEIEMGMAFIGSAILIVVTVYFVAVLWRHIENESKKSIDLDGIDIDVDEEDLDAELPFGLKLAQPDPRNPGQYHIIDPIDLVEEELGDKPTFPRASKRRSSRKRR